MSKHDETLVIPGDDDDDSQAGKSTPPDDQSRKGVSETIVSPTAQHEKPVTRRKVSETLVASPDEMRQALAQQRGQFNAPEDFADAREEKKVRRPVLLFLLPLALIGFLIVGAGAAYVVTQVIPAATEEIPPTLTTAPTEIPPTVINLPNAPSSIRAVVVAIYDIPVGWADTSDNEEGFYIYRTRVDIGGAQEQVGSTSTDTTNFLDSGTTCGAIYEYTISSYNAAGESPTTECWQIIVPACPQNQTAAIGSGSDRGLNFITGAKGIDADFYWTSGEPPMLMADLPGQKGFIDLGNTGDTPLYDVVIPEGVEAAESVPLVAGNTYMLFPRDGYSVVIFRAAAISEPLNVEYIIWQPGSETIGQCGQLASIPTPEPTPTTGGGATCIARAGDGVCCVQAGENNSTAPSDCFCVDDGVCAVTAGETGACCDCDPNCGGGCGRACSDSSHCGRGLSCAGGVCWDACICGQDCGGGDVCTPTSYTTHCENGFLVYVDNCGKEMHRSEQPNICPFKP